MNGRCTLNSWWWWWCLSQPVHHRGQNKPPVQLHAWIGVCLWLSLTCPHHALAGICVFLFGLNSSVENKASPAKNFRGFRKAESLLLTLNGDFHGSELRDLWTPQNVSGGVSLSSWGIRELDLLGISTPAQFLVPFMCLAWCWFCCFSHPKGSQESVCRPSLDHMQGLLWR